MAAIENRTPPSSLEAEQSILGSMLLSDVCAAEGVGALKERDFYLKAHRRIFAVMQELMLTGKPVDLVTVIERMEVDGKLSTEELTYLTELTDRVPSVRNLGVYIDIVREKSVLRQLIEASGEIADMSLAGDMSAGEVLSAASDRIYSIANDKEERTLRHIRHALLESYNQINNAAKNKGGLMGVSTGFPLMDQQLSGLAPSQLIIIAGRTGMGKTSFALNICEHIGIKERKPVAIFSLEMSADQLAMRLMCAGARVDSQKARTGGLSKQDYYDLAEAMVPLEESMIYIDDTPNVTAAEILAKCRRLRQKVGDLGVICIDYLQLMTDPKRENRQQEIASISRSVKLIAREMNTPVLLLSQLKRAEAARETKPPRLSDLRESGSIEQDADVVLFLHREDYFSDAAEVKGKGKIIIAKQRSGPTGAINVMWAGEQTKYTEVDFVHMDEMEEN